MRTRNTLTCLLAATTLAVVGALTPLDAVAQEPSAEQSSPPPAPPKPYKPVAVTLPKPVSDPTFATFRKQLLTIAQKKDRAGLARIIAQNFFWIPEDEDIADKRKSGIDNLAKAIGLEGNDSPAWETLAAYANETSADPNPNPERKGVICAPGEPKFEEAAAEELATATDTEANEWAYPAKDGIEVRSGAETTAPVVERLGLHLVRVYPDDSPAAAVHGDMMRIVTPSGKLGFVPIDLLLPLQTDQLCYVKDGTAWKIAGVIGGGAPTP